MLFDARIPGAPRTAQDLRQEPRHACGGDVVVRWHHDMGTAIRYRLLEHSDDGMRIMTSAPLVRGMSGVVVTLLPEGRPVNRLCIVRWSRGEESGLRLL
jgi:hypothetical protein